MSAVRVRLYQHPLSESADRCPWTPECYRGELYLPLSSVETSSCSHVVAALEERLSRYAILHLPVRGSRSGAAADRAVSPTSDANSVDRVADENVERYTQVISSASGGIGAVHSCSHDNRSEQEDVTVENVGPQWCTRCSAGVLRCTGAAPLGSHEQVGSSTHDDAGAKGARRVCGQAGTNRCTSVNRTGDEASKPSDSGVAQSTISPYIVVRGLYRLEKNGCSRAASSLPHYNSNHDSRNKIDQYSYKEGSVKDGSVDAGAYIRIDNETSVVHPDERLRCLFSLVLHHRNDDHRPRAPYPTSTHSASSNLLSAHTHASPSSSRSTAAAASSCVSLLHGHTRWRVSGASATQTVWQSVVERLRRRRRVNVRRITVRHGLDAACVLPCERLSEVAARGREWVVEGQRMSRWVDADRPEGAVGQQGESPSRVSAPDETKPSAAQAAEWRPHRRKRVCVERAAGADRRSCDTVTVSPWLPVTVRDGPDLYYDRYAYLNRCSINEGGAKDCLERQSHGCEVDGAVRSVISMTTFDESEDGERDYGVDGLSEHAWANVIDARVGACSDGGSSYFEGSHASAAKRSAEERQPYAVHVACMAKYTVAGHDVRTCSDSPCASSLSFSSTASSVLSSTPAPGYGDDDSVVEDYRIAMSSSGGAEDSECDTCVTPRWGDDTDDDDVDEQANEEGGGNGMEKKECTGLHPAVVCRSAAPGASSSQAMACSTQPTAFSSSSSSSSLSQNGMPYTQLDPTASSQDEFIDAADPIAPFTFTPMTITQQTMANYVVDMDSEATELSSPCSSVTSSSQCSHRRSEERRVG